MVAVTIPTRRYWTTATTRSSPPRSRLTATSPDAPPAVSASIPVSGVTPGCRPRSRPAAMLTASVPVVISRTGSQSAARPLSVEGWASTPMTTPITAWASVVARRGTVAGARPASASAVATTRPAKSAGEGSRSSASATVPTAVPTTSSAHRRPSPVPTPRSSPRRGSAALLPMAPADSERGSTLPPWPRRPNRRHRRSAPFSYAMTSTTCTGCSAICRRRCGELPRRSRTTAFGWSAWSVGSPSSGRMSRSFGPMSPGSGRMSRSFGPMSPGSGRMSPRSGPMSPCSGPMSPRWSDVTGLRSDVTGLRSDVTEVRSDVTEVRSDVTELRTDVTELRTDVSGLRGGMAGVRGDLGGLRTDVDGLRAGQDEILRLLRDRA